MPTRLTYIILSCSVIAATIWIYNSDLIWRTYPAPELGFSMKLPLRWNIAVSTSTSGDNLKFNGESTYFLIYGDNALKIVVEAGDDFGGVSNPLEISRSIGGISPARGPVIGGVSAEAICLDVDQGTMMTMFLKRERRLYVFRFLDWRSSIDDDTTARFARMCETGLLEDPFRRFATEVRFL